MSVTFKTIEGLLVIIGALGLGYGCRRARWIQPESASRVSRAGLSYLSPWVMGLVLWALQPLGWKLVALPIVCTSLILLTWPLGAWVGRRLFSEPRDLAPWIICATFSNGGTTYGAFLCYILLGAQGAALAAIYWLPFTPLVYLLGFYMADRYAHGTISPWAALRQILTSSYSRNPLLGMLAGGLLLAFGSRLPLAQHWLIDVLVPLDTAIQLFAIGVTLRLSRVAGYLRPVVVMHALKFLALPVLGLGLAALFGLWGQAGNQLVQVVFIESCTPVAILALVVAQAARLNTDLANSLWLTTNLVAVGLAPLTLLVARVL